MPLSIPPGNFKGLILDFDGTLVDSMMIHQKAWKYAMESVGGTFPLTIEEYFNLGGTSTHDVASLFLKKNNLSLPPEKVVAQKELFFSKNLHEITPIAPVLDFAMQQNRKKLQLSIASGSSYDLILSVLEHLQLESYFPHILTPRDVEKSKPAPDLFLLAAQRMNLKPEECLVFEDSPLGIQAAESAGMSWVLVPKTLWNLSS